MVQFFKNLKKMTIITSVLLVVLGVLLIVFPKLGGNTICSCIGVIMALYGTIGVIKYFMNKTDYLYRSDLVVGLALLAGGVVILAKAEEFAQVLVILLGIFIIISGIIFVQYAVNICRLGYNRWWIDLILALLSIAFGIVVILDPLKAADASMILIGAAFCFIGLVGFWTVYSMHRVKKTVKAYIEEAAADGTIVVEAENSDVQ